MTVTLSEAIRVLSQAHHRGAWCWCWNPELLRVTPADWNGLGPDEAPAFTVFEALAIARGLALIGAVAPSGMSTDILG
jgi:hypothetical protein